MPTWHMEGVPEFEAALERLSIAAEVAGAAATAKGAHLVEANIKTLLSQTSHKKGTRTPSAPGSPPAVVTGTLRRSITVDGPTRLGFGVYKAQIGPTVVYGRIQELGGQTGRGGSTNLPARPFTKPGLDMSMAELGAIYRTAWAEALRA